MYMVAKSMAWCCGAQLYYGYAQLAYNDWAGFIMQVKEVVPSCDEVTSAVRSIDLRSTSGVVQYSKTTADKEQQRKYATLNKISSIFSLLTVAWLQQHEVLCRMDIQNPVTSFRHFIYTQEWNSLPVDISDA